MPPTRRRILLLSILSGLLLTAAWPDDGGLTPLIFLAWVPLLWAERFHEERTSGRKRAFFPYVLLCMWTWNIGTTWWLGNVTESWDTRLFTLLGPATANSLLMCLPWVLRRWARRRMGQGWSNAVWILCWLAFEHLHMDWDLSWPWLALGNVFAEHPVWVQWYSVTGAFGGTLWVLLVNLMVFHTIVQWKQGTVRPRLAMAAVALMVLPVAISMVIYDQRDPAAGGRTIEVVAVQPNIDPYGEKFNGDPIVQLQRMLAQAEGVMTDSTDLVLFPETALQEDADAFRMEDGTLQLTGLWENTIDDSRSVRMIRAFQKRHPRAAVLAGMSSQYLYGEYEAHPQAARPLRGTSRYYTPYNAAMLVDPNGHVEPYHKSKLVPGVEEVPFERFMGPLKGIALDLGGTTGSLGTQEEREVMRTDDGRIALAPAICYESIYGDHVAAHVRNGATLIAIITNDGWWGDSPAYHQHLAYGRLRAIETRRSIARCANTGISCFIDQRGDTHQVTGWWVPAAIRARLSENTEVTVFVRFGDVIGRVAVRVSLLVLALVLTLPWLRRGKASAGAE